MSAASPTSPTKILNPDTYLNHLSPEDARDYEICRNVTLAVLGALLWDILVYFPDDIYIVRRSRFTFTIFCFISARLFAAGFVISSVIRRTIPLDNPNAPTYSAGTFCVLAFDCSAYLFLCRVHAVYADSPRVRWFFTIFWLTYSFVEILVPVSMRPSIIPGTHYYRDSGMHPYVAFSFLYGLLFDSAVFLAVSYKIVSMHTPMDEGIRWRNLVSGQALPKLSRAVLQGGQQYYLLTVGMMGVVGLFLYLPFLSQIPKAVLPVPLIPLVASMACRVFRNIKLFDFSSDTTVLFLETTSVA